ncbi:elongation factor Ts [Roseomonas eburnea]|uniref:Elongation factor Ts n=1 Tax=Neoroseomonas eburnea TaxID=1346889 RepID=A0A9X9XFI3_9PROT|nr:translation elongation factor Ts [Neoroseomonas eburnea]MBR0682469.1 elongation factor Ts [Neoroseomonas eburnea]
MAEITAAMVRDLREKTGAGMMDCKKALVEAAGDMEAAIDWLRKKGLSAAAKKSGRVAAEGLIGVASAPRTAAMVEVNAETDFVARNELFQNFVATVAELVLTVGDDVEKLKNARWPGSMDLVEGGTTRRTVAEQLTHLIATIGENMTIRRAKRLHVNEGAVATYVHSAVKPGLGKIGVLVALEGSSEASVMETLGRQIGMHVAAARPEALDVSVVDPAALDREKAVLTEQAKASGKPDAVIQKMVEGRIRKYYEEVVLLEQVWVHDGESRVKEVVKKAGANLAGFARFQLGEGIEKQVSDFAAEVAAAAGQG